MKWGLFATMQCICHASCDFSFCTDCKVVFLREIRVITLTVETFNDIWKTEHLCTHFWDTNLGHTTSVCTRVALFSILIFSTLPHDMPYYQSKAAEISYFIILIPSFEIYSWVLRIYIWWQENKFPLRKMDLFSYSNTIFKMFCFYEWCCIKITII